MKTIIRFICIVIVAVVALSCQKQEDVPTGVQADFLSRTAYGVYSESGEVFVYDEGTCQLYHSPTKYSSRIMKDDRSAYITVTFKDDISAGATVIGSVLVHNISVGGYKDYDLQILKVEGGKAWVWYDRREVGYVIPWGI